MVAAASAKGRLDAGLDAGLGVEGEDEGSGEDEQASGPGGGAEYLAEDEDAKEGADERLHVEEDSGLGCGYLGEPPVPEEGGGGGAEDAGGGGGGPGFGGEVERGPAPEGGNDGGEHEGSGEGAVGGNDEGGVALHEVLVEEDPGEGDGEREDDDEVSGERGLTGTAVAGSKGDEGSAAG